MFSKAALSTSPRTAAGNGFVRGSGIVLGLAAALLLLSAPARADRDDGYYDQDSDGYSNGYDYADVLSAEPNLRQVRVVVPRRECYTDTRYVPADDGDYRRHRPAGGPMILGGLIGAVVGHQIGSGDARGLGTVAGAMIGGAVGHDIARRQAAERDDADRDQDGMVGLDELYEYVYDKVRAATPNQTPGKWTFGGAALATGAALFSVSCCALRRSTLPLTGPCNRP